MTSSTTTSYVATIDLHLPSLDRRRFHRATKGGGGRVERADDRYYTVPSIPLASNTYFHRFTHPLSTTKFRGWMSAQKSMSWIIITFGPGNCVTVICDSYFWALIQPLNFVIEEGAWTYEITSCMQGICRGLKLQCLERRSPSPRSCSLLGAPARVTLVRPSQIHVFLQFVIKLKEEEKSCNLINSKSNWWFKELKSMAQNALMSKSGPPRWRKKREREREPEGRLRGCAAGNGQSQHGARARAAPWENSPFPTEGSARRGGEGGFCPSIYLLHHLHVFCRLKTLQYPANRWTPGCVIPPPGSLDHEGAS